MHIVRPSDDQDKMPSCDDGKDFYIDMCDSDDVTDVMKLPSNNTLIGTKGN